MGLGKQGCGGAGRARNVQQVVLSSLSLFILLSWSKPSCCLPTVP